MKHYTYIYILESTRDACQGPFIAFPLLVAEPGTNPGSRTWLLGPLVGAVTRDAGWRRLRRRLESRLS